MADAPFCGSFRHDSVTNRYPKKKGRYTHSTIGGEKKLRKMNHPVSNWILLSQ